MNINKANTIITVISLAVMIVLLVIMIIDFIPLIKEVMENTGDEARVIDYIDKYGSKGIPILIGMQILQVVLTFIPAAAINVLAGLCYRIWLGSLISMIGVILGNALVFFAIRQFKKVLSPIFKKKTDDHEKKKHKLISVQTLNEMKHPEYLAFFFFLIPGIPNGILPYIFAQTKISIFRYLITITIASIPSIIIFNILGDKIGDGNYSIVIIIAVCAVVIMGLVFLFRNKIVKAVSSLTGS